MTEEINGTGLNDQMINDSVDAFAEQMKRVLHDNKHKGGWDTCTVHYLLARLVEEVGELSKAILENDICAPKEAVDVANFAMMISEKLLDNVEALYDKWSK